MAEEAAAVGKIKIMKTLRLTAWMTRYLTDGALPHDRPDIVLPFARLLCVAPVVARFVTLVG